MVEVAGYDEKAVGVICLLLPLVLPFIRTFVYAKNSNTLMAVNNAALFSSTYQALSLHRHAHTYVQVTARMMSCHLSGNLTNTMFLSRKHSIIKR